MDFVLRAVIRHRSGRRFVRLTRSTRDSRIALVPLVGQRPTGINNFGKLISPTGFKRRRIAFSNGLRNRQPFTNFNGESFGVGIPIRGGDMRRDCGRAFSYGSNQTATINSGNTSITTAPRNRLHSIRGIAWAQCDVGLRRGRRKVEAQVVANHVNVVQQVISVWVGCRTSRGDRLCNNSDVNNIAVVIL